MNGMNHDPPGWQHTCLDQKQMLEGTLLNEHRSRIHSSVVLPVDDQGFQSSF